MKHSASLAKIPPGVTYIFGDEVLVRRAIERTVLEVFAGWSYSEIMLPAYDYYEMFARGMGPAHAEATFCFTDAEGGLLALRPDMTSLVARTVATRFGGKPRPARLCYAGEVFRNLQAPGRAPREAWQVGAELIGSDRLEADAEILFVAIEALQRLGVETFTIAVGHAGLLNGVVEELSLDETAAGNLREALASRSGAALRDRLREHAPAAAVERIAKLLELAGGAEILSTARELGGNATALDDLEHVWDVARALGLDGFLRFDFADARTLDYYTGMTFKMYSPGIGAEIGGGGRYDNLLRNFGVPEPAVGFRFVTERLVRLLRENGIDPVGKIVPPVVLDADSDNLIDAFQQARALRAEGKTVAIRTARHSFAPELMSAQER